MSKYKQFRVTSKSGEHFVDLAVDLDILTPDQAEDINSLWSNVDHRLTTANGDALLALVRMFGAHAINHARYIGGWSFNHMPFARGLAFAQQVVDSVGEGWPDAQDLGIAVIGAYVGHETFDTVSAVEQ